MTFNAIWEKNPEPEPQPQPSANDNTWAIVGIMIGVVVVSVLIGGAVHFMRKK